MRYKLDTTCGVQDHYELRLYELDYTPMGKKYKSRYRLTVLFMLPFWWLLGYILYPDTPYFFVFAFITLVAEGIWQLLTKPILRRRLMRQARQEEKMYGFGPSEMFFYDDGFCDLANDVKFEVEYRNVRKAVFYKSQYFFLYTQKMVFTVPCRPLTGQVTVAEFADFLRSRGITLETVQ